MSKDYILAGSLDVEKQGNEHSVCATIFDILRKWTDFMIHPPKCARLVLCTQISKFMIYEFLYLLLFLNK